MQSIEVSNLFEFLLYATNSILEVVKGS